MNAAVDSHRPNPFPGLRPFRSDEHHLFFGREEQTAALLQLLRTNRFLAVVGTSGSGKSSLVRAGLIAELHGGTMTHAGSTWEVMILRPGGSPIENLARAFVDADLYDGEDPSTLPRLLATLNRSRFGLVEAMKQSEQFGPGTNLLVVVDQFEELFRFRQQGVDSQETATAFVNLLLTASEQAECPIYVAITMRSDYLGDCSEIPGLAEAVNEGEYLIPRLLRDQKRDAIEKPIGVGGAKISPLLVQRLLNEVGDDPDQLPVLQHALMRMWSVWSAGDDHDRPIDFGDFEATGGLGSALSNHADEVYDSLPDDRHRSVCEKTFKALTEKGSDNRGIRRPTRLADLQAIADCDRETVGRVLDAFRGSGVTFVMPGTDVELSDRTVLDLSHESLMRCWQRLRGWVEDEAQSARIFRRLLDTARLWGEGKAGLYHDPDLQIALSWREQQSPNAEWAEEYGGNFETTIRFLETSNAEAQAERRARETARQRELAQAQELAESRRQRLEQQQRSTRKLRKMVGGLAAVALVAGAACVAAILANRRATQSAAHAQQSALEANRQSEVAQVARLDALDQTYLATRNEIRSMRLARQSGWRSAALNRLQELVRVGSRNLDRTDLRTEALACLAETDVRIEARFAPGGNDMAAWHVRYSPDGRILAANDGQRSLVHLYDPATNQRLKSMPKAHGVAPFAFHPGGALAMPRTADRIAFYPLGPGQPTFPEVAGEGAALGLAFSRSGERLAVVWGEAYQGRARRVSVHETASGAALWAVDLPAETPGEYKVALAISPDGQSVATIGPKGEVRLFSVGKNDEPVILGKLDGRICAIDFHPDGKSLVAAGRLSGAVWDLTSRSELFRIHAPEGGFWDVAYSPDGQLLAAACNDRIVRLWDSRAGRELSAVPSETGNYCLSVAFSPRGDRFAAAGGTVSVFEIEGRRECRHEDSTINNVNGLAFDKTRPALYSCGGDHQVRVWSWNEGPGRILRGTGRRLNSAAIRLAPDGRQLALGFRPFSGQPADSDCSILIVPLDDSKTERRLAGPRRGVLELVFDPSGKRLAASTGDGGLYLWDFESGVLLSRIALRGIGATQFLDENQLVAASGNRLILLAAADGAVRRELTLPDFAARLAVAPDRKFVFVLTRDGTIHRVRLPDLTIERSRMVLDSPSFLLMEISPDGKLLAVSTQAGPRNLLIDPRTLEPLANLPGNDMRISCLAFDSDGRYFALAGAYITLWDLTLLREGLELAGLAWDRPAPGVVPATRPATQPGQRPPATAITRGPSAVVDPVAFEEARRRLRSGSAALRGGRTAEAIPELQRARDGLRTLCQTVPFDASVARHLAISLVALGGALRDEHRPAEAVAAYREASQVLEALGQPSPVDLYNLACAYANLSALVEPGAAPPSTAERQALAERAMGTLRQALAAGMTDFALIEQDHDLDALRKRPDFLALILEATGRTREAVPHLATLSAANPQNTLLSLRVAALQAWFAQDKELAATRQRVLAFAKGTAEVTTADRAAKVCTIVPSSDKAELEAALALGREAVKLGNGGGAWNLLAQGMAEYRSGDDAAAEKTLRAAVEAAPDNVWVPGTAAFYRAMSLFRQGKPDEARQLAIAAAAKMRSLPADGQNPLALDATHDDVILWLAYREAKALIQFDDAAPPPKAGNEEK